MSSPSPSMKGTKTPSDIAEPLYQVKLLAALRSGDAITVQSFLTSLSSRGVSKQNDSNGQVDIASAALHLAIRVAPVDIVQLMLSHRSISPNAVYPCGSKTTALHLASSLGRADVVELLLEQPEIDDTLRDAKGRTCKEVARGKEVQQAIRDSQSLLQASFKSLLRTYILSSINSPPPPALLDLISSPRSRVLDLSYLDDSSGTTLLHEATRRKDLRLVELSVRVGADVFVRDRRGKTVGDSAGRDDRVKVFLRQFTNQDTTLLDGPSTSPPVLKGFLNKYTNMAKGYNARWFVLKDGVLSYYRNREEENVASRGSISMISAIVKPPLGNDKQRFEILSHPTNGRGSTAQRWWVKANHPGEASRWVHAIQRSIEWAQNRAKEKDMLDAMSSSNSVRTKHSKRGSVSGRSAMSSVSHIAGANGEDTENKSGESSGTSFFGSSDDSALPHGDSYELHSNAILAQVEMTDQILDSLSLPPMPSPRASETKKAIKDSLMTLQSMIQQYNLMTREREDWWKDKLEKEKDRAVVWEESLNVVVREGEVLERELRNTLRSRKNSKRRTDGLWTDGAIAGSLNNEQRRLNGDPQSPKHAASQPQSTNTEQDDMVTSLLPVPATPQTPSTSSTPMRITVPTSPNIPQEPDTDDEDEFFDAIEANNLPNLVITSPLASSSTTLRKPGPSFVDLPHYAAYNNLRKKMPIGSDGRPVISLWSVLKNNIGKDLTRISFPVTFNEPTSMLQRMAEDMEFSECLDAATSEDNPHRRIAFVAAFAMSNYSSTIGRIAKPFNPMLGETFEYVNIDKNYRYVSEQVCHHPPISACWAEAPSWHYYGEVDAQNRFMGKSFEIRPTGVAHADLILPEAWGPSYPKAPGNHVGKVVEHYTWKKVTTNVSGFILGSPTIDHYGEMTVINHRTNDKCILTFKPRGWRGKDAYEINGRVMDSTGRVIYDIAGRWNSQLVAREVGTGIGSLLPDVEVCNPELISSPSIPRYILLWRNTQKPKSPFNLTPFAITLNDCPGNLKSYICPTDCRLRPDQRAFEMGKYELANQLKLEQEEFQRATRRKREEGIIPPHRPKWFVATTDKDTRERVWEPIREEDGVTLHYWTLREKNWSEKEHGREAWIDVDPIFIEADID